MPQYSDKLSGNTLPVLSALPGAADARRNHNLEPPSLPVFDPALSASGSIVRVILGPIQLDVQQLAARSPGILA